MRSSCRPSWARAVADAGKPPRRGVARCALAVGFALVTTPALCGTHTIAIEGMQFSPATMTVKRGERVVWINKDLVPHTATAAKAFDSGPLDPGKSWRMTTTKPGRYEYVCTFHPTMKAVLVVE